MVETILNTLVNYIWMSVELKASLNTYNTYNTSNSSVQSEKSEQLACISRAYVLALCRFSLPVQLAASMILRILQLPSQVVETSAQSSLDASSPLHSHTEDDHRLPEFVLQKLIRNLASLSVSQIFSQVRFATFCRFLNSLFSTRD